MCGIKCEAFIADLHQACDTGRSGRVKKKDAVEGRFSPFDREYPKVCVNLQIDVR